MIRTILRGYCYMIVVFFLISSLDKCASDAHAAKPPVTPPEWRSVIGKHCAGSAPVRCDVTLSNEDCARVAEAVALINNSTSATLLSFEGRVDMNTPDALDKAVAADLIFVTQATKRQEKEQCASRDGCVLAMTSWGKKSPAGCFAGVHVQLTSQANALTDGQRYVTVVHELLHALGLSHNPFPIAGSMINTYAPQHVPVRPHALGEFETLRLCILYDCRPIYFGDLRGGF